MSGLDKTLTIRSSPHIGSPASVDSIMLHVVVAMLPVCAYSVYAFGTAAVLMLATAVLSCVLTEHALCRISNQPTTIRDHSALVTGFLYGLVLPPGLALWMVGLGGMIAISLGKFLFGGLGANPFNPALVGRAILQAAFPVAMTTWTPVVSQGRFSSLPTSTLAIPFTEPIYDGVSAATPLADWKSQAIAAAPTDLLVGSVAGSLGETSALLIILGGVYLAIGRMLNWRIPVSILGTVALTSALLHAVDPERFAGPGFMLLSGGLMLGAVFMATDMVASPMTNRGRTVYGIIIGLLVVIIRVGGGMPEGVMFAILIGNALSPHIDHWIQPTVFGTSRSHVT